MHLYSALSSGWYTSGGQKLWGLDQHSTYNFVPPEALPVLPAIALNGDFAWLPELAPGRCGLEFAEDCGGIAEGLAKLNRLKAAAEVRGIALPNAFVTFMSSDRIHSRVPSNTACSLDVSCPLFERLSAPDEILVRFVRDSQDCVAWYLLLDRSGGNRVIGSWHLDYDEAGELVPDVRRAHVVASDFESFVHRFWFENLLWFNVVKQTPLSPEEALYLATAHKAASLVQGPGDEPSFAER